MTEFDAVTVRGLRKRYGPGVVVDRLDFDVSRGEMAGVADADCPGKTITARCIQGLRRTGGDAIRVPGGQRVTGPAQLRPLIGGQLQGSALPDRLRAAGPLDLFATSRARDGTEQLGQSGLGERGRRGFSSLSGREPQWLFLALALPGRPERTS